MRGNAEEKNETETNGVCLHSIQAQAFNLLRNNQKVTFLSFKLFTLAFHLPITYMD